MPVPTAFAYAWLKWDHHRPFKGMKKQVFGTTSLPSKAEQWKVRTCFGLLQSSEPLRTPPAKHCSITACTHYFYIILVVLEGHYCYGHLSVITGCKWDSTLYKWGYEYL